MRTVLLMMSLVLCVTAAPFDAKECVSELQRAGVSQRFNETVAHAIHSMTVQGLKLFNPRATVKNKVSVLLKKQKTTTLTSYCQQPSVCPVKTRASAAKG